jgi:hypothetical protein
MNPVEQQRAQQINAMIARLPPEVRAKIVQDGAREAKTVLPVPYWSTVRIRGTVAANTLTVDTSSRKAFAYAVGQPMDVAGFAASTIAQFSDTNLLKQGETLDNANVWIWGLAAELYPNSDPVLAARLWRESIVELSLNGTTSIKLGTLGMFPSAGGLYGQGQSALVMPSEPVTGANDGGQGATVGFVANGNPMGGNFLKFPQPFKWSSVGGGGSDANLSVIVTPTRAITIPLAATRAAAAGTTGAYTQPSTGDAGTFCDIRFRLISVAVSERSVNT